MFPSEKFLAIFFFIISTIDDVSGHIRLTYPKPRQSLDFLLATRENEPCGLSQRSSYETFVKAGNPLKVTWISTVPSKYNVSFYILDGNGATKNHLSAKHEEIRTNIHSESSYEFPLSSDVCRTCILRIEQTYRTRNSIEKLWSCADVSIRSENVNPCLNQGRYVNNQCLCTGYFTGEFCQTENRCINDDDCGGPAQGKCIESELQPFIYGKICICRSGYMGLSCEKKSVVNEHEDKKFEQFVNVADDVKLSWKYIEDYQEVEFSLKYPSSSGWIALGIKGSSSNGLCVNWKSAGSNFSASTERSPVVESTSVGMEDSATFSSTEESVSQRTSELETKIDATATDSDGDDSYETDDNTNVPAIQNANTGPKPQIVSISEAPRAVDIKSTESCYGDWRWPESCTVDCEYVLSWTFVEDLSDIEFSMEAKMSPGSWTGVGFSKDMNITDADFVAIKLDRNSKVQILDCHLTIADPKIKPVIDSNENIRFSSSVSGTYSNGILRSAFSRDRMTPDVNQDAQFSESECFHFLFPVKAGVLSEDNGFEALTNSTRISNQKVCVKTCGRANNGGKTSSSEEDSTEQDYSCDSVFKYPTNCSFPDCDYFSSWTFNVSTGLVDFIVKSRPAGHWAGIGFSRNGKMANSDVVIGYIYDNAPYVTDRFAKDNSAPIIDKSQDIINAKGEDDQETDMQTLYFSRKVDTNDQSEDISLYECPYYLFPVGGGRISAKNSDEFKSGSVSLEKHETFRPQVSSKPICLCKEDNKNEDSRKRRKRQDTLETADRLIRIIPDEPKKLNVRSFIQSNDDSDECLDVIVAQIKDNAVFIGDFFGNGLSTPVLDDDWGVGRQSFTYVSSHNEGANNILNFRRKLVSEDLTDYNIERNSPSSVIAVSKNPNNEPNIEKNARNFLSMYDSKTVDLNFLDIAEEIGTESPTKNSVKIGQAAKCKASYSSPKDCVDDSCSYFVEWSFEGEHLSIKLEATLQPKMWTGVGFSADGFLNNSNIVVAILNDNNSIELTDRFIDRELRPIISPDQSIFDIKNTFKSGRLRSSLKLSLASHYKEETRIYQHSKCFYILYPISGGKLSESGEILPFAGNVEVERSDEVCGCRKIAAISTEDRPKERGENDPTTVHTVTTYSLKLKLLKPSQQTNDETVKDILKRYLIKTLAYDSDPGSLKVDSLQIKRSNGSFLVDVELSSSIIKDKELLKNVLFYEAANNPTHNLKIDPNTIETQEVSITNAPNDKTRLIVYVLIGTVVILIVFTILICVAFYFCLKHDKVAQPKKRFFSSYPDANYPISKSLHRLNVSPDKYDLSKSRSRTRDRYSANQTSSHYLSDFPTVAANSSSYFADHGPIYPNAVTHPKSKRNRDQAKNSYPRFSRII